MRLKAVETDGCCCQRANISAIETVFTGRFTRRCCDAPPLTFPHAHVHIGVCEVALSVISSLRGSGPTQIFW